MKIPNIHHSSFRIHHFLLLLLLVAPCHAAWQKQKSGTLAWLHGVYFLDVKTGFVVGSNGTILKTADGGENWTKIAADTKDNLRDVFFSDAENGWILVERSVYTLKNGEARSYLLRTSDGGATWKQNNFPNNSINALIAKFIVARDKKSFYAVGEVGTLYALEENQSQWRRKAAPTKFLLQGGAILNAKTSWLVGAGASIVSTNDGGSNWRENNFDAKNQARFYAADFVSDKIGWTVGAGGKILTTRDGGKSWREQKSETTADLLDVRFVDARTGFINGENGTILTTQDGGAAWKAETTNSTHRLERLFFNDNAGFSVGFGGTIFKFFK